MLISTASEAIAMTIISPIVLLLADDLLQLVAK
jgi:hypothetical protein